MKIRLLCLFAFLFARISAAEAGLRASSRPRFPTIKKFFLTLALIVAPRLHAASDWQDTLAQSLPLLGHRNWIVVADYAYLWQVIPGVRTINTGASQLEVTQAVLKALTATRHVKPAVYVDHELAIVPEDAAPGISAYRADLAEVLDGVGVVKPPHEQIIAKLDEAGKTFHVILLKTKNDDPLHFGVFPAGVRLLERHVRKTSPRHDQRGSNQLMARICPPDVASTIPLPPEEK